MDLDFSDEQEMLRDTVRRICEARFDSETVRKLENDDKKLNAAFWKDLCENGLCALRIDEAYGGASMSALDVALVFEEFGRALASSPFLQSAVVAAELLTTLAPDAVKEEWLSKIASGEVIVVPAWQESDLAENPQLVSIDVSKSVVTGEKLLVPFANSADMFLVSGVQDGVEYWALAPAQAEGLSTVALPNYASQPLFAVRFDNVKLEAAHIFEAPERFHSGAALFGDTLIAVAAEAVGASDRLLALTVDYANQREQFGRPIGSFQAISHPLAECASELEGVRYLVYQAACAKDENAPYLHLAQMAKLRAAALFRRLATVSVQVHGGIGYSSEGEPQLFYRRSKYHELMYGTASELKKNIADHVFA